jgi:CelD/BcsL family acetyltransferase involved in cellulose biosynthesis
MAASNLTIEPAARRDERTPLRADQRVPATASPSITPAQLSAPSAIRLHVASDLDALEAEWKSFEQRADGTVFQSFDWLAKWQKHIGARRNAIPAMVCGHGGDELLFILPLAVETRGLVRRLTWLGSELCDYNAPLLAESFTAHLKDGFAPLWRDVVRRVRADRRLHFDLIDLQKMPAVVGNQRNPFLDLPTSAHPSGAYVATLGTDWETFHAAKRSGPTRKRERRQLKHLAEHGEIRLVEAESRDDLARTLETLIDQKSRAFARMGVEDIFARPGHRDFYLDVATDPAGGLSHVSRLDVGGATVAANLGLRFRDCYYLLLSSYQDGELARFGPGRAHLHELLRTAIERGFRRFDFTVGDEPYKRDWSDIELTLSDHLAGVTMRGRMVAAASAAYRRAKRFVKQTPVIWRLFSKIRSLAAPVTR